jgi:hypothetical protein
MANVKSLPAHPSLEYLKKLAKERLKKLRRRDPATKLAAAQLAIAREFGFSSWRKLKTHVDQLRATVETAKADENQIREFSVVGQSEIASVAGELARRIY